MADDKPQNADFIGRVVSDAKNPPETRMLTGWFGDSSEEGHRRLYSDAELHCYADIPDDAILYSEPVRDSQPSGCVMVWIKRDADVKQGGSAASRAARFLQGQVQQDFASAGAAGSLDKAGLRCVTQVPCGEPTGFTGQCTKQPDVGGAWPCITAIPHCYEVTGFTGKCTQAPWPNPTRYIGCTILHCPTHDLTHIPHICNIVATGQPGCVVVNPPQGGDPAEKVAEVDEKEAPATSIPGCGYTKTWGVCDTHLLGCGKGAQDDAALITSICAPTAFCHVSQNCGGAPGADTWTTFCTRAHPPVCYPTEACHTQPPQCGAANFAAAAPGAAAAQPASAICATAIGCDITVLCPTRFRPFCFPTPFCPTLPQQCFPVPSPFCPVTQACPFGTGGSGDPAQRFAAFNAAAPGAFTDAPCSAVDSCPSKLCFTQPPTALCTQIPQANCPQPTASPDLCPCTMPPEKCPTGCGVNCQTPQPNCTQCNCPTLNGADCPPPSIGIACTALPPCPGPTPQCPPTKLGPPCPTTPQLDCTFGCTQAGTGCPVTNPLVACGNPNVQAFAARAAIPVPQTQQAGCPASDFVACSQFGGCPTLPKGDCTFFGCPSLPQYAAAGPGGGCTQSGPQCPTHAKPQCTFFGPACPPTPGIVCTQLAPCPTHQLPCHTPGFECTMFCTQGAPGCPQTQNPACFGPITAGGPQCPPASGFNCPSQVCQSIACQSAACQPGGGQQFARAFDQSTEFCPTSGGCGGAQAQAIGGFTHPTPATHCFVCPPFDVAAAARGGQAQPFQTSLIQCINQPTPATRCFICPPFDFAAAQPQPQQFQTAFIQCINQPTPATHCFVCPPFDAAAAQRLAFPPNTFQLQCHPHSGLPIDCPFPSLFYVCTAVQCTVVCLLR
jgi:hypothetical protein